MTEFIATYGLAVVFAAVALESVGVPVPGEASVIAASLLAARGDVHIGTVILIAATAAIAGDNVGYVIGRCGGRRLLQRWGALRRRSPRRRGLDGRGVTDGLAALPSVECPGRRRVGHRRGARGRRARPGRARSAVALPMTCRDLAPPA